MDWLGLAVGLVKLLQGLMKWLGDKQLIDAGKAEASSHSLGVTMENLTDAKKAADYIRRNPDAPWSVSVRDKYRRP